MTPEALNAAKKRIIDACADYIKVRPEWVGQLDGCDVFYLWFDPDAGDDLLLGPPCYALFDPKKPGEFVCTSDVDLAITSRLEEAEAKAKAKAVK